MTVHVHMDRFGRVLIPKAIRYALGLQIGSGLEVVIAQGILQLRPTIRSDQLIEHAGRLILSASGTITADPVQDLRAICLEDATDKW